MSSKRGSVGSVRARSPGRPEERSRIRFLGESDAFADVLGHLRLGPLAYCRSELTAPWGLDLPFEDGIRFHYLAEGGCWLVLNGQRVRLDCGDIALVFSGTAHWLLDAPSSPASPAEAYSREIVEPNLYRMTGGGGGAPTVLVCCRAEVQEGQQILGMLPTCRATIKVRQQRQSG